LLINDKVWRGVRLTAHVAWYSGRYRAVRNITALCITYRSTEWAVIGCVGYVVLNNKMVSERKGSITKRSWPVLRRTFLEIAVEMIACLQVAIGKWHFQKREPSTQLTRSCYRY
jgi:hypothetical protein